MVNVIVIRSKPPPDAGFASADWTVGPSVRGRMRTANDELFWIVLLAARVDADGLLAEAKMKTPDPFGTEPVPARLVPILFPCKVIPPALGPSTWIPIDALPETRFPSPSPGPPITLLGASLMKIPCWFGTAAVPSALVPIRLPNSRLFDAGPTWS